MQIKEMHNLLAQDAVLGRAADLNEEE